MQTGLRLLLRQSWLAQPEPRFTTGEAFLALHGPHLLFYAAVQDKHPFNEATRRNELTWEKGDVIELFLQKDGASDYYEFHVTPENQRLQLHFADATSLRSGLPLETWMVEKDLFESFTRIDPRQENWEAFMRIDLVSLFGSWPAALHFLVGRYDAQPGHSIPVTSSSAQLTRCNFHCLDEWSVVELPDPEAGKAAL